MHILQPKHEKMNETEVAKLVSEFNIALSQLPKISRKDPALPEGSETGDVIKISREGGAYYRVVI